MKKIRIGIMGGSSFAQRAMIPAAKSCAHIDPVAIASRSQEKATALAEQLELEPVIGYDALVERDDLDALYIPLPTGLHEEWCSKALRAGKHILVEKSFAENLKSAERMLSLARDNNCLVFENFQFQTHAQWKKISGYMNSDELGPIHLVRSTFGFPPLPKDNFRWDKNLGGGALLDAGAYMTKVAQLLLGTDLEVLGASLTHDDELGVDVYGEAMFRNPYGQVAQVAFGFDYFYQCRVELLGTRGKLSTNRVFTAPPDFCPVLSVETQGNTREETVEADNHYENMWAWFAQEISGENYSKHWNILKDQARLLDEIRMLSSR